MQELCPTQGDGPPVPPQELTPTGTALAQPKPAGEVSDEELHDAFYRHSFEDFGQRLMTWQEFHAGARAAIALDRSRRAALAPRQRPANIARDQAMTSPLLFIPTALNGASKP